MNYKDIFVLKAFGNQLMMQAAIRCFHFSVTTYRTPREDQLLAEQQLNLKLLRMLVITAYKVNYHRECSKMTPCYF